MKELNTGSREHTAQNSRRLLSSRLYDLFMVPLEAGGIARLRRRIIPRADGKVLEVGAGTGVNLKYYDFLNVSSLTVSDHEPGRLLRKRAFSCGAEVAEAEVTQLPFEDSSFDTLVFTLLFCSVEDPKAGLKEIKRVVKPGGKIIFIEHVLGCSRLTQRIQHSLTPFWRRISGNCHLNRETYELISDSGFTIEKRFTKAGCVLSSGIGRR
jgi:ubiquinone/menaquinone biosynthesis C-methylase UbiE